MKIKHVKCAAALLVLLANFNFQLSSPAQGTAFTYQCRLSDGVNPASGNYDLRFTIYDSPTGGIIAGGPLTNAPTGVSNGLFTVTLEFGSGVFTGSSRWLEIGVRTNGSAGAYQPLSPRQAVTAAPYAVTAGNVTGVIPSGSLSGTYPGAVTLNNAANNFTGNGAGLTSVNASQLTSGTVPSAALGNAWRTVGNSGTSPTNGNILGTTDNQPLELWVNSARALRLEPSTNPNNRGAPNVIGGAPFNFVSSGAGGATVGGGGSTNYFGNKYTNSATADFATVSGGADNTASSFSATLGGGLHNTASGSSATVGGGQNNLASGSVATVGGGIANTASSSSATVGGGSVNTAGAGYATVGGGSGNSASGSYSTIAGGYQNTNVSFAATVSGGQNNSVGSSYATVGGGFLNAANSSHATVGGGSQNTASGAESAVAGGLGNIASGNYSAVPGGDINTASGDYSFAGGHHAQATHAGSFVWAAQSSPFFFGSTTTNQFSVQASGGVRFETAGAGMTLDGQAVATSNQLTNLNATNITSGTLAAARMPALTGDVTTTSGSVATTLANTGVTPGSYSAANITVDSKGRVVAASNGATGAGSSNYVFAVSTTFQPVLSANVFQDATFDADWQNSGWIHNSGTATYTATQTGLYLIEYTAKAMTTGAPGSTNVSVVAVLNSLQLPGSQNSTDVQIGAVTLSKSFIANINAADVLKLQFTGTGNGISLNPFAGSGVGAAKSSISMTIVRIQ